jgi:membrane fusion protein (multidrug efflux system)
MTRRKCGHAALAIALAASGAACGRNEEPETVVDDVVPVTAMPARLDTLRDLLVVPGLVVPAAATDWTVTAPEPARIVELPKAEGEAVAEGDLLVRLELPSVADDIAAADLAVTEARARAFAARDEVAKLAPLHERGMISRNMFDAAQAAAAAADSALQQAEARRAAAGAGADRAVIRARFPGIVVKRWHIEGEFVAGTPSDGILRVVDPTKVQVAAQVPLTQFSRILPGHAATVTSSGGAPEAATVVMRQPPTDATATTAEVRFGFAAATTLTIDTAVQVDLLLEERRDVVVVTSTSVRRDDQGAYVMIAGDDGVAHRRTVRTGLVSGPVTQITQGLAAGERVIMTGLDQIADGSRITAR